MENTLLPKPNYAVKICVDFVTDFNRIHVSFYSNEKCVNYCKIMCHLNTINVLIIYFDIKMCRFFRFLCIDWLIYL